MGREDLEKTQHVCERKAFNIALTSFGVTSESSGPSQKLLVPAGKKKVHPLRGCVVGTQSINVCNTSQYQFDQKKKDNVQPFPSICYGPSPRIITSKMTAICHLDLSHTKYVARHRPPTRCVFQPRERGQVHQLSNCWTWGACHPGTSTSWPWLYPLPLQPHQKGCTSLDPHRTIYCTPECAPLRWQPGAWRSDA